MTVLVAMVELCVVTLIMIWQVTTLIDRVNELQEDMHATARWLARMEACRVRAARQKDGENDGEL